MTSPNNPQSQGTTRGPGTGLQPNPEEVNEFHKYDDVDGAPESHHHTLGNDANQASPGTHSHNGIDSPKIGAENLPKGVATGSVLMWAGSAAPEGYYLCNGQSLDRTTEAALFAVIGTTYGAPSASTFAVPNLSQRFPMGVGGSNPLAQTGGQYNHTHLSGTSSHSHGHATAHSHSVGGHSHVTGSHNHGIGDHSHSVGGHGHPANGHAHSASGHSHTVNSHNHGKTDEALNHRHGGLSSAGVGGQSFTNYNDAGLHGHNLVAESPGTSSSGISIDPQTQLNGTGYETVYAVSLSTGTTGSLGTDVQGAQTSGATSPGGTDAASTSDYNGQNNPPFLVLNFIIKN